MPGQSQQRPAAATTPAQAPAAPSRSPSPGVGNAALQARSLAQAGQAAPGGAEGGAGNAQAALRDRTHAASVSVSGRLPANALIGSANGNELKTGASTGFSVGVGRSGIWARFNPALLLTPGGFWERMATGGITLSQLYFSFESGRASLSIDTGAAGDFLDLFMDLKDGIEARFADAVTGAMPAELRGGNYDPYTDPMLSQRLAAVVTSISTAFPAARAPDARSRGGDLLSKITEPEVSASVTARPMELPISDGMRLRLSDRAQLNLRARLEGTMGDALSSPRLRELRLETDGLTLEHKTAGLLGGLDLHSITFGPDLSVRDMRYSLGAETAVGLLKVLGMIAQLRTGQDLGVRDTESPEFRSIRARVEEDTRARLPGMLRDQIRQLSGDLPGLPLGQLLARPQG